jgi:hypothetical protein
MGPAYRDQWYPYPVPVPERFDLSRVDAIYVSHSHEDHLHAPTLRALLEVAPDAQALIPLRADTQMRDYLQRIGFRRIRELASGSPFVFRKGHDKLRLTLLTHVDDSLLAVQGGGETLLNLNDALHASRRELILEFCRVLRGRFPSVDYLFCGFGGASYFPNCVHVPGKDDVPVARARERYFLQNFGLIASLLKPRFAFPFAAHFVLPDEENWWISETRLRLEPPSETLRTLLQDSAIELHDLRPGDWLEGRVFHGQPSTPAGDPEEARATVRARYGLAPSRPALDDADFDKLVADVRERLASRPRQSLDAVLVLTDYPARAIHLDVTPADVKITAVDPVHLAELDPQLTVKTRSDLIRSALRTPFGKDLISIGYGGQFYIRSTAELANAPHDRFLHLLSPTVPRWRQQARAHPWRTIRYLVGDPSMRYAAAGRMLAKRQAVQTTAEPAPYELRDWVAVPES